MRIRGHLKGTIWRDLDTLPPAESRLAKVRMDGCDTSNHFHHSVLVADDFFKSFLAVFELVLREVDGSETSVLLQRYCQCFSTLTANLIFAKIDGSHTNLFLQRYCQCFGACIANLMIPQIDGSKRSVLLQRFCQCSCPFVANMNKFTRSDISDPF